MPAPAPISRHVGAAGLAAGRPERVTPEESRLLRVGASLLAAQLRHDDDWQTALLTQFDEEPSLLADAFTYVTITAATIDATISGRNLSGVLDGLDEIEMALVPSGSDVRWADAVDLAIGVSGGNKKLIDEAAAHMDVPTAVNSAYSVALSVLSDLQANSGRSSLEWAEVLIEGANRPD